MARAYGQVSDRFLGAEHYVSTVSTNHQAVPVIGFYVLPVLIGRVTRKELLSLARPRAQEPGDYTSYLQSSSGLYSLFAVY